MNQKNANQTHSEGGYQGGHPLIKIRRSGVYVTEAKLRSNLFLTDLPPGNPVGVTGKSAGGFRRGVVETPLRAHASCVSRGRSAAKDCEKSEDGV